MKLLSIGAAVALSILAMTLLPAGCPQGALSAITGQNAVLGEDQTTSGNGDDADASGGDSGPATISNNSGATTSNGDTATTNTGGSSDTLDEDEAYAELDDVVQPDDALYTGGDAPTLTAEELAALAAELADPGVSEAAIGQDVSTAKTATRRGLVAAHGRLAALFSETPPAENPEAAGSFEGMWISSSSEPMGTIAGDYTREEGPGAPFGFAFFGTFAGQYFDLDGEFQGVITGRYGVTPAGRGYFVGQWRDESGELVGALRGRWRDSAESTDDGALAGRWAAFNLCEEAATLPEVQFETGDTGGLTSSAETISDTASIDTESEPVTDEPDLLYAGDGLCLDRSQPYGFMRGRYGPATGGLSNGAEGGRVRCLWRDSSGAVIGYLLGRYEPEVSGLDEFDRGARVGGTFYAKYVDQNGRFIGFVRGTYGRSENGLGVFEATYFDQNDVELGWLVGRWRIGLGRVGGPVFGLWNETAAR